MFQIVASICDIVVKFSYIGESKDLDIGGDMHSASLGVELSFLDYRATLVNRVSNYATFTGRTLDQEMPNSADTSVNPDVTSEIHDKSTINKIMVYMALAKQIVQFDLTEGPFSAQSASLYARQNSVGLIKQMKVHGLSKVTGVIFCGADYPDFQ